LESFADPEGTLFAMRFFNAGAIASFPVLFSLSVYSDKLPAKPCIACF